MKNQESRGPVGHSGPALPPGLHVSFDWSKWSRCDAKPPQESQESGKIDAQPEKPSETPAIEIKIEATRKSANHAAAEIERFFRVCVPSPTGGLYDPAAEQDPALWDFLQTLWRNGIRRDPGAKPDQADGVMPRPDAFFEKKFDKGGVLGNTSYHEDPGNKIDHD